MKIDWIVFVISLFFVKGIRLEQVELEEITVESVSQIVETEYKTAVVESQTVEPEFNTVKTEEKVEKVEKVQSVESVPQIVQKKPGTVVVEPHRVKPDLKTVEEVEEVEKSETVSQTAETESQTVESDSIGPIQILAPNGTFFQYVENNQLEQILSSNELKEHYIVVISAIGRFQTGKSFLLNVFLEYLRSKYATQSTNSSLSNSSDWLSTNIENRFDSKHNNEGNTKGMWAWPEIFTHNCENGDKLAIMLLDTEGMHEIHNDLMVHDVTIFTLSTLTSSMQFYNFHKHITNVDSQIFQLFSAYAELVSNMTSKNGEQVEKPFQRLNIIIRDYRRDYKHDKNDEEITKKLSDLPIVNEVQPYYNETFQVFTLPQPANEFDGVISNATKDFTEKIQEIVPKLLSPDKLLVKNIFGQKIKAKDLMTYFKEYTTIFTNESLPKATTILNATASVHNYPIYMNSLEFYESLMNEKLDETTSYYKVDAFQEIHSENKNKSVDKFDETRKIGREEYTAPLRKKLLDGIAKKFAEFNITNEQKRQMYFDRAKSAYETSSKTIKDQFVERLYEKLDQTEPNRIDTSLVANIFKPLVTEAFETFNKSEYNDDKEVSAVPQKDFSDYFSNLWSKITQALELYNRSTYMYVSLMNSKIENGKYYNETELNQKHQDAKKNALSVLQNGNGTNVFSDVGCDVRNKKDIIHILKCDKINDFIEKKFDEFKEINTARQLPSSNSPSTLASIMGFSVIVMSVIIVAIVFYYLYLCCCNQKSYTQNEYIFSVEENRSRSNSLASNSLIANSRSNSLPSNSLIANSIND